MDMEKQFDIEAFTDYYEKQIESHERFLKGIEILSNTNYDEIDTTPKEIVFTMDKMKLYHYKPHAKKVNPVPVLIVYALMNRQYIMDLQQSKSFVKKLSELGLDVYMVDWGYPTAEDMYITMEDYVEDYFGSAVDYIRRTTGCDKINLMGKCMGGTFAAMYTSLHPEKVLNLVTIAAPFEFDIEDGVLFKWSKHMDTDKMVNAYNMIPGDMLNFFFIMLNPYHLSTGKYIGLMDVLDNAKIMKDFVHMEKWIFDCPDQAGEYYKTWMKDLWSENKLKKGEFYLGDKHIDLKKITHPVLNVYGDKDNLIPMSSSIPFLDMISSKDKEEACFPVGHAGIVASSRSQKFIAPKIAEWVWAHSK
ncbi:MAG: class III poly(R)-hydroxyalkanoic acid synthase subunit PhaC [Lentihominibacter sp.]|jgi:polyhydroxyalkanoate synthase